MSEKPSQRTESGPRGGILGVSPNEATPGGTRERSDTEGLTTDWIGV